MTAPTASCPNCGAEIVFRWSGAVQTSCPACKSVLVRHDLDLQRVGTVGDVPASMSRIQLGTEGRFKRQPFVVVGRIVYEYQRGHWSEWHIRLGNGTSAWLSDAQGEYAVSTLGEPGQALPSAEGMKPGETIDFAGTTYTVASRTLAAYRGVEGELPFEYWDKQEVMFVDLKAGSDKFGTLDYSDASPLLFLGEYEEFDELHLTMLREPDAATGGATVQAKGLNCPQCGAALELRTGGLAQTIACPACTAVLDATDPNLTILQKHQQKVGLAIPLVPLGSTGRLGDVSWTVVGFQVRGITVEGVSYAWREYLLWNVDRGFQYLTEYHGHWNVVAVVKGTPKIRPREPQPIADYQDMSFRHFQAAVAETHFVLGEFPWEARVGDKVNSDDYVAPPLMLSREATADEATWSLGTYTAGERIQQAFGVAKPFPAPLGVFANQPNPFAGRGREVFKLFGRFALVLFVLLIARFALARKETVFSADYLYTGRAGDTAAFVTPAFDLRGRTSNIEVRIETNLYNNWAYFDLALLNDNGGAGYEFGREVSNYAGVDDGEAWHEGSAKDHVIVPSIPPGRYYLRVDLDHDTNRAFGYKITVRRDVPRVWPFIVALLLLVIPPLFGWLNERGFEQRRWAESDYAPTSSDDGGGDDDS